MQKNKKVLIIAAVVLILIAAALFFIEGSKKPVPIEGAKTITVTVMQEGVENKVFTIHTDAEFLRGALEQEKLVEGILSELPLREGVFFLVSPNGIFAFPLSVYAKFKKSQAYRKKITFYAPS